MRWLYYVGWCDMIQKGLLTLQLLLTSREDTQISWVVCVHTLYPPPRNQDTTREEDSITWCPSWVVHGCVCKYTFIIDLSLGVFNTREKGIHFIITQFLPYPRESRSTSRTEQWNWPVWSQSYIYNLSHQGSSGGPTYYQHTHPGTYENIHDIVYILCRQGAHWIRQEGWRNRVGGREGGKGSLYLPIMPQVVCINTKNSLTCKLVNTYQG